MEYMIADQKIKEKTSKQLLYVSMVSMVMTFAGLTSAYVISSKREDWVSVQMPSALFISTILIVLSSLTFFLAKKSIKKDDRKQTTLFLVLTLLLGFGFVGSQFLGFEQLREAGFYLAGKDSVVSSSMLMVISLLHILHVLAGLITVIVVIYNHFKKRYNTNNFLGLELGAIFWHFVDILWVLLFLFFMFVGKTQ